MLATGAGTAYYFYASAVAEQRLEKAIAEADRLEPGWRVDDVLRKQRRLPDKDNGAFQRTAVEQMLAGWRLPRPISAAPQIQLTEEQTASLRANLQGVAAALEAARKLAHAPDGSQPLTWTPPRFTNGFQPMRALEVGKFLSMDAMLLAQDSKLEQALASCRAILGDARTLGNGPDLMTCLVRTALDALAVTALERILAQGEASETALADLQEVLGEEAAQPLYLNAFRGQRALTDRMFEALNKGEMKVTDLFPAKSPSWLRPGRVGPEEIMYLIRAGSITNNRAAHLEMSTRLIEIAKLPDRDRARHIEALKDQLKDQPLLARQFLVIFCKYQIDVEQDQVKLRLAIAGIAAERYRLAHGSWPGLWRPLSPSTLPAYRMIPLRTHRYGCSAWTGSSGFNRPGLLAREFSLCGTLRPAGKFCRKKLHRRN
ncbi:MAG TPA: hypothetical protein VG099_04830 [Gemmataceae bacterium]|nr:hypothetical protein [Gemmataceae bacterium]